MGISLPNFGLISGENTGNTSIQIESKSLKINMKKIFLKTDILLELSYRYFNLIYTPISKHYSITTNAFDI